MTRILAGFVVGFCAVILALTAVSPELRGDVVRMFREPGNIHLEPTP